jgi:hypothetical protein
MADQHSERRAQRRIRRQIPITVASCAIEPNSSAVTRDLSTSGIFFHTDSPIRQGSSLEIVLLLPPELTAGEKRWVCCRASVVRVENRDGAGFGVAATIESMESAPEIVG